MNCVYCEDQLGIPNTRHLRCGNTHSVELWSCTRPKGHTGPHVACSSFNHDLVRWKQIVPKPKRNTL